MKIIFVRHGKAFPRVREVNDINRQLTPEGQQTVKKGAERLGKFLKGETDIYLWSSPADRAYQTAWLISEVMDLDEALLQDFIWTGNRAEFQNALQGLAGKATVIVVGHQPDLGQWMQEWTGHVTEFRKSAIAVLEIRDLNRNDNPFEWIFRAPKDYDKRPKRAKEKKELSKKKPSKAQKSYGSKDVQPYVKVLQQSVDILKKEMDQLRKGKMDVKAIHGTRVAIRRVRSLIAFFRPLWKDANYQQMQNELDHLGDAFSTIRQMDVLLHQWHHILDTHPDMLTGDQVLREQVKQAREQKMSQLRTKESMASMIRRLDDVDNMLWNMTPDKEMKDFDQYVNQTFRQMRKSLDRDMERIYKGKEMDVHKLRIEVKKMHYVREQLGKRIKQKCWCPGKIRRMQNALGILCDIDSNAQLLNQLMQDMDDPGFCHQAGILIGYQQAEYPRLFAQMIKRSHCCH